MFKILGEYLTQFRLWLMFKVLSKTVKAWSKIESEMKNYYCHLWKFLGTKSLNDFCIHKVDVNWLKNKVKRFLK